METIREFIEKAVKEYNTGELTPEKLIDIRNTYRTTFESEHESKRKNLNDAHSMLFDTFIKQKGERISKKLDFEWCEYEKIKVPNPFYEPEPKPLSIFRQI